MSENMGYSTIKYSMPLSLSLSLCVCVFHIRISFCQLVFEDYPSHVLSSNELNVYRVTLAYSRVHSTVSEYFEYQVGSVTPLCVINH